jgi:ornithine carbamoyltransferase
MESKQYIDYSFLTRRQAALFLHGENCSEYHRVGFEFAMAEAKARASYSWPKQQSHNWQLRELADYCGSASVIFVNNFLHEDLLNFALQANVPVINAGNYDEDPCSALAAFFTIIQKLDRLQGIKIAFIGDASSGVFHSLMLLAASVGAHLRVACPAHYSPSILCTATATGLANATGSIISISQNPYEAIARADIVCTGTHFSPRPRAPHRHDPASWAQQERQREKEWRSGLVEFIPSDGLLRHAAPDAQVFPIQPLIGEYDITYPQISSDRRINPGSYATMLKVLTALVAGT